MRVTTLIVGLLSQAHQSACPLLVVLCQGNCNYSYWQLRSTAQLNYRYFYSFRFCSSKSASHRRVCSPSASSAINLASDFSKTSKRRIDDFHMTTTTTSPPTIHKTQEYSSIDLLFSRTIQWLKRNPVHKYVGSNFGRRPVGKITSHHHLPPPPKKVKLRLPSPRRTVWTNA